MVKNAVSSLTGRFMMRSGLWISCKALIKALIVHYVDVCLLNPPAKKERNVEVCIYIREKQSY
ncbi:hypothetical protein DWX17_11835 [[Clostridium] innocuum]|nr:hypothetical protein DWX17_11835 [[Clostridium] innocuum]